MLYFGVVHNVLVFNMTLYHVHVHNNLTACPYYTSKQHRHTDTHQQKTHSVIRVLITQRTGKRTHKWIMKIQTCEPQENNNVMVISSITEMT